MHLAFEAQEVSYNEPIDGEIVQASFQEEPDSDDDIDYSKKNHPLPPLTKYVLISANYEFPPTTTTVEWSDGKDFDGGKLIIEIELSKTSLKLLLEDEVSIELSFKTDDITFKNIERFLLRDSR